MQMLEKTLVKKSQFQKSIFGNTYSLHSHKKYWSLLDRALYEYYQVNKTVREANIGTPDFFLVNW